MRPKYYQRFHWTQVLEHWVLLVSFSALALTGLPQKYSDTRWAHDIADFLGGVGMLREIHHAAAVVMILAGILHLLSAGYKVFVLRTPLHMLPRVQDCKDFIQTLAHYMGRAASTPRHDRYSYVEKVEYWALVWGTLIMMVTGLILWNPIWFTAFLPGDFVPAAKAVHGYEAMLAVLSIVTWHFYHVHLKHLNLSIFTGRLSSAEMERDHPLELERIPERRALRPDPTTIDARWRVYRPVAAVVALLLLGGVYYMVTVEETAIETVMGRGHARSIPHALELRDDCLACHQLSGFRPFPADHIGRGNEDCHACHRR